MESTSFHLSPSTSRVNELPLGRKTGMGEGGTGSVNLDSYTRNTEATESARVEKDHAPEVHRTREEVQYTSQKGCDWITDAITKISGSSREHGDRQRHLVAAAECECCSRSPFSAFSRYQQQTTGNRQTVAWVPATLWPLIQNFPESISMNMFLASAVCSTFLPAILFHCPVFKACLETGKKRVEWLNKLWRIRKGEREKYCSLRDMINFKCRL